MNEPPQAQAIASSDAVLAFWREAGEDRWFEKDDAFDDAIRERFLATYEAAAARKLDAWTETPEGALALCIVLDQFPRNMFRGSPRTFELDGLARHFANIALKRGYDQDVPDNVRSFFFLPFMHSENLVDQERCIALYREADDAENLKYAEKHAAIIRRFGRFPHRNALLGRPITAEEQAFLDEGGFKG
jgi:uncharacterized protein (DUF924 family)